MMSKVFIITYYLILVSIVNVYSQGVAINEASLNPDNSAILDVSSTNKGILIPRLSTSERDLISSPALSLLIYNTDIDCFEFWAFSAWHELGCVVIDWQCGDTLVDDRDGNIYKTVQIGNKCWMGENLKYLPNVSNILEYENSGIISAHNYVYGYNGNDTAVAKAHPNYTTYGALYNWPSAMGLANAQAPPSVAEACNGTGESQTECNNPVRGICPEGWHLPSYYEFIELFREACPDDEVTCASYFPYAEQLFLGDFGANGTTEANRLKLNSALWSPNNGTNNLDFSAIPAGMHDGTSGFTTINANAYFWSSTFLDDVANPNCARRMGLVASHARVWGDVQQFRIGQSVRCIKD